MLRVYSSEKPVLIVAAEKLNYSLSEAISKNKTILLVLSGGSSLDLLDKIDNANLSDKVTVSPLDERFSTDPQENNMAQIVSTDFYKKALKKGCQFIDTRVRKEETQDQLAARFNAALNSWIKTNPDGQIIVTLGIGSDGHISGIMPFPEDPHKFKEMFDNGKENDLVIGYDATGKNPYPKRVTTTMNLLRRINTAVGYVVGENKRNALNQVCDGGAIAAVPARILNEIEGKVYLFTDVKIGSWLKAS